MWPVRIGLSMALVSGLLLAQQNAGPPRMKTASDEQVPGDPVKGLAIFQGKGGCLSCHRVASVGSLTAPDLSEIATQRSVEELRKALLDPSPDVQPRNQVYRVVTRDGKTYTGKIFNQDEFSLQMVSLDSQLHAFTKSDLKEYGFQKTPPMPSYRGKLSTDEETNLIAFLASLKSPGQK